MSMTMHLIPPFEVHTHIQKEMIVKLDPSGTGVTITHKITNKNVWPIELAPWGLTIMRGGGVTIVPQEPFKSHMEELLPARPMVLWGYTDLSDPRWTFGKKYVRLRTDENLAHPQKIGVANKREWAGYLRENTLFIKRFPYIEGAKYPDYGCNFGNVHSRIVHGSGERGPADDAGAGPERISRGEVVPLCQRGRRRDGRVAG